MASCNHRAGRELAGKIVGADTGGKHRVPTPDGLLPKRPGLGEDAVFHHPLISTPDVVDENIDLASVPGDTLESGNYLLIIAVVATDSDHIRSVEHSVHNRSTGDEYFGPAAGKLRRNTSTHAFRPAGDESDSVFQASHISVRDRSHPSISPWRWKRRHSFRRWYLAINAGGCPSREALRTTNKALMDPLDQSVDPRYSISPVNLRVTLLPPDAGHLIGVQV